MSGIEPPTCSIWRSCLAIQLHHHSVDVFITPVNPEVKVELNLFLILVCMDHIHRTLCTHWSWVHVPASSLHMSTGVPRSLSRAHVPTGEGSPWTEPWCAWATAGTMVVCGVRSLDNPRDSSTYPEYHRSYWLHNHPMCNRCRYVAYPLSHSP